mmetsp:Transcript_719/g.2946  ORF Transcript_719/g.2946 Transcript_719/m.2946 type:complete len:231 (+) Transcript_719:335-1027(+)
MARRFEGTETASSFCASSLASSASVKRSSRSGSFIPRNCNSSSLKRLTRRLVKNPRMRAWHITATSASDRLFRSAASANSCSRRVSAMANERARPCRPRSFRWIRRSASSSGIAGARMNRYACNASISALFAEAFKADSASSAETGGVAASSLARVSLSLGSFFRAASSSFRSLRLVSRKNASRAAMLSARSSTKHRGTGISTASGVFLRSPKTSSSANASTPSLSFVIQ